MARARPFPTNKTLTGSDDAVFDSVNVENNAIFDSNANQPGLTLRKFTSAQRSTLKDLKRGTVIYNTNTNRIEVWTGNQWASGSGEVASDLDTQAPLFVFVENGTGTVGLDFDETTMKTDGDGALAVDVSKISSQIVGNNSNPVKSYMDNVKSTAETAKSTAEAVKATVDVINTVVDALEAKDLAMQGELTTLETTASAHTGQIASLQGQVGGLGGTVTALGATVAANSAALLGKQDAGDYATNTALTEGLATKQDIGDYATNTVLTEGLATKQPIGQYITVEDFDYALSEKQEVGDYAMKYQLIEGLATKQDVGDYVLANELSSLLADKQDTLTTSTDISINSVLAKSVSVNQATAGAVVSAEFKAPNVPVGLFNTIQIGNDASTNNMGRLYFNNEGTGSASNSVGLGLWDAPQSLRAFGNGDVHITNVAYAENGRRLATKEYVDTIAGLNPEGFVTETQLNDGLATKQNTITSSTDITPKKVTAADTVKAPGFLADNQGDDTYTGYVLATKGGAAALFRNSEDRTVDGGANTATLRNDNGNLRLLSYKPGGTETGIHVSSETGITTVYHDLSVLRSLTAPNALITGWGLTVQDIAYAEGGKRLATREYVDAKTTGPLRFLSLNDNGGNEPVSEQTAIHCFLPGRGGESYPSVVNFDISRFDQTPFGGKTQLKLKMTYGDVDVPDVTVATFRSDGDSFFNKDVYANGTKPLATREYVDTQITTVAAPPKYVTTVPSAFVSPTMTGYTHTVLGYTFVASASNDWPGQNEAYKAFGVGSATSQYGWITTNSKYNHITGAYEGSTTTGSSLGEWIQMEYPKPVHVQGVWLKAMQPTVANPRLFDVCGSNDGTTWTTLYSNTTSWVPAANQDASWSFTETTATYKYVRLVVTAMSTFCFNQARLQALAFDTTEYEAKVDTHILATRDWVTTNHGRKPLVTQIRENTNTLWGQKTSSSSVPLDTSFTCVYGTASTLTFNIDMTFVTAYENSSVQLTASILGVAAQLRVRYVVVENKHNTFPATFTFTNVPQGTHTLSLELTHINPGHEPYAYADVNDYVTITCIEYA